MDKDDWIRFANEQQAKNMGYRGLTPDQQKAVKEVNDALKSFMWEMDECKDVWLSTTRRLEAAMYDMQRAFDPISEYQVGEMLQHGITWDIDGTWFDNSKKSKK